MIITEPNKVAAKVHDRMPVLLSPEQFDPWLLGNAGVEILKPAPDSAVAIHPVSRRVNSSRADDNDATLIDQVAA
jgi:putative SOS response-associated peptidase YedK